MYQCNKTSQKVINYDDITKENINKHNLNWPQISDHTYTILIIRGSGSRKTNALLNLIKQQDDDDYSTIDKTYLYVWNPIKQNIDIFLKTVKIMVLKV